MPAGFRNIHGCEYASDVDRVFLCTRLGATGSTGPYRLIRINPDDLDDYVYYEASSANYWRADYLMIVGTRVFVFYQDAANPTKLLIDEFDTEDDAQPLTKVATHDLGTTYGSAWQADTDNTYMYIGTDATELSGTGHYIVKVQISDMTVVDNAQLTGTWDAHRGTGSVLYDSETGSVFMGCQGGAFIHKVSASDLSSEVVQGYPLKHLNGETKSSELISTTGYIYLTLEGGASVPNYVEGHVLKISKTDLADYEVIQAGSASNKSGWVGLPEPDGDYIWVGWAEGEFVRIKVSDGSQQHFWFPETQVAESCFAGSRNKWILGTWDDPCKIVRVVNHVSADNSQLTSLAPRSSWVPVRLFTQKDGTITALEAYTDGSNSLGTGVNLKGNTATDYTEPTTTELNTTNYPTLAGATVDAFGWTSGSPKSITGSATEAGDIGDFLVLQVSLDSNAAGCTTPTDTLTPVYTTGGSDITKTVTLYTESEKIISAVTSTASAAALLTSVADNIEVLAEVATVNAAALSLIVGISKAIVVPVSEAGATAIAPSTSAGVIILPDVEEADAVVFSPLISIGLARAPPAIEAAAVANIPSISTEAIISVPTSTASSEAPPPEILTSVTFAIAFAEAPIPIVTTGATITSPVAEASVETLAPAISTGADVILEQPAISTAEAPIPTISASTTISSPTATASSSIGTTIIGIGKAIAPPVATSNGSAIPPLRTYGVYVQIDGESNDAYEYEFNGGVNVDNFEILVVSDASAEDRYWGGLRFTGGTWPSYGSTITAARISIHIPSIVGDDPNCDIYAEASANPSAFTTATNNISGRTKTSASAEWIANGLGTGWKNSPSLVTIIQELVDSYNIESIALIIQPNTDVSKSLIIDAWDESSHTLGAILHLEWEEPSLGVTYATIATSSAAAIAPSISTGTTIEIPTAEASAAAATVGIGGSTQIDAPAASASSALIAPTAYGRYGCTISVSANTDDAMERESSGVVWTDDFYIYVQSDTDQSTRYWVGLRFTGGPFPNRGDTIDTAYLRINVTDEIDGDNANLDIYAQDRANPTTFTTDAYNITRSRPRTSSYTEWVSDSLGTGWVQSPSIVDVIQELVNSYDITSVVLTLSPNTDATKLLTLWAHDWSGGTFAAQLHLEWTPLSGGVSPTAAADAAALIPSVHASCTITSPIATATSATPTPTASTGAEILSPIATASANALIISTIGGVSISAETSEASATTPNPSVKTGATISSPVATASAQAIGPSTSYGTTIEAEVATATASVFSSGGSSVIYQVDQSSDDADEYAQADGLVVPGGTSVRVIVGIATYWGGVRFRTGSFPTLGSTITSAYLTIQCRDESVDDANFEIYGDDREDPSTFTDTNYDISSRTLTSAFVSWVEDSIGAGWAQSPSIVDVIQELVDAYNVASIALVLKPLSGSRLARFHSWDEASHVLGAKLYLTWEGPLVSTGVTVVPDEAAASAEALGPNIGGSLTVYATVSASNADAPIPVISVGCTISVPVAEANGEAYPASTALGWAQIFAEVSVATAETPAPEFGGSATILATVAQASAEIQLPTIDLAVPVPTSTASAATPAPTLSAGSLITSPVAQSSASIPTVAVAAGTTIPVPVATAGCVAKTSTIHTGVTISPPRAVANATARTATVGVVAHVGVTATVATASAETPTPMIQWEVWTLELGTSLPSVLAKQGLWGKYLPSAARIDNIVGPTMVNNGLHSGLVVRVRITSTTGAPTVTPEMHYWDSGSGKWVSYINGPQYSATGEFEWIFSPIGIATTNWSPMGSGNITRMIAPVPAVWRVGFYHGNTDSITYSAMYQYMA
jgi:hypothetical protein